MCGVPYHSVEAYLARLIAKGYKVAICDQMEEKENGTYLFLSKKDNGVVFEYKVDILDESFNLSYVHITANNDTFHIDFDN